MEYPEELINIAKLSPDFPVWVTPQEYETLKNEKRQGWSHCKTQKEWMVKLHYLRQGYKSGKIDEAQFLKKEKALVLNWWQKWL